MISINPYTQQKIFEIPEYNSTQITQAIDESYQAQQLWKRQNLDSKKKLMTKLATVLEENAEKWGEIMTLEMGKPISQSIAEIKKCAWVCRFYAENAAHQLSPQIIATDATKSFVSHEALGVILGVMPWNYPFWQVFRFAVPTLLAGNTVLLKHASNVMKSAQLIAEAIALADFPQGVYTHLPIASHKVESVIRNPKVKGVSLTGSRPAGAAVSSIASEEIKPSLLELGGNNALVVFDDCDWNKTLKTCINARFQNTGQSCIAGKRLLVQATIANDFIADLKKEILNLKSGNPLNPDTEIGVLAQEKFAIELQEQMNKSIALGAKLECGGKRNGAYFSPTLLTQVSPEMPVFYQETFGPLLACSTFSDEQEALKLVNQSIFGLGTSIFTQDKQRISRMIREIEDGAVFVNELVKSDPRLPFGGTKTSGFGRELSTEGILAFVNKKTVYIS